jgi:oxygen-independent coproporphyrinogen-3 oxidase
MSPIGVYVHFPFCLKKCPYCDFVSFARARADIDHEGYANAVIAELDRRRGALAGRRLETVFFGGGTPSLWEPAALGRVLAAIMGAADERAADVEVTAECNPTSLDEDRARAFHQQGVGRLSVGVQGLDAERLAFLGRLHDPEGGLAAVRAALRAGVPRVSADLIYGVATGEAPPSPDDAAVEVGIVADTGVGHVSAYSLTIEPGTQFGELARRGRLPIAPDDAVADAFFAVEAALEARGFRHYEISNYARPGDEARHNLGYWRGVDYLGLGCAAFGTLSTAGGSALRYRNIRDPARYVAAARSGAELDEEREDLSPEARLRERLMLGLRLGEGVDLATAERELGVSPWTTERRRSVDRLVARGRLVVDGDRLRVPREARIWTDGIAADLF